MKDFEDDLILLGHGSGGALTNELIRDVFQDAFGNPILDELLDAAVLEVGGGRIAFTTDSFVVDPIFFPGGDIGKIAVCGTVNDLAVSGAKPSIWAEFVVGRLQISIWGIVASIGCCSDRRCSDCDQNTKVVGEEIAIRSLSIPLGSGDPEQAASHSLSPVTWFLINGTMGSTRSRPAEALLFTPVESSLLTE